MYQNMRYLTLLLATFGFTSLFSQKKETVVTQIKSDITYLASDQLEGRLTGSSGELKSSLFIADEFKKNKLIPKGDSGLFFQNFSIIQLRLNTNTISMTIRDQKELILGLRPQSGDFYPLSYSCNADSLFDHPVVQAGYGIVAPQLKHNDYLDSINMKGKVFIIKLGSPKSGQAHSEYSPYESLSYKVNTAIRYGARAVIFVQADTLSKKPTGLLDRNIKPGPIPVVFANKFTHLFLEGKTVSFYVKITQLNATAHNVVGFMNNKKAKTIVIGAHQDHLGYNEYGGSRDPQSGKIHNGADDNASGVAMMLQLMRKIKKTKKLKKFNYLFIAFSGEEQGLLGSNHFVNNPSIELKDIHCMLNFDMVGRLDSNKKTLMIYGVGTAPELNKSISSIKTDTTQIKIKTSESGTGSSDHTSFYYKNIPVLHYFTGQHHDYHKPSDDEHLINYDGMYLVYNITLNTLINIRKHKQLNFTPTKAEESKRMSFKVKLGIMPDYAFDGLGVKADGVNMGGVAQIAGMKANDIIIKLGDYEINSMGDYMSALASFDKGDKVVATVKRGAETLQLNIQF
jgi:aminopeptidase YwaD